jgi:P-type Cu+ transporter
MERDGSAGQEVTGVRRIGPITMASTVVARDRTDHDGGHHENPSEQRVSLLIGGMTCGACARRVERTLNRLDGVEATVNYATEKAEVVHGAEWHVDQLVAAIEKAGYRAETVPARDQRGTERVAEPGAEQATSPVGGAREPSESGRAAARPRSTAEDGARREARTRLALCAALAIPVVALAMIPAAQFRNWQWLSLTLAAPVAVWGAWPMHRVAWSNIRRGAATMDTLVSVGVLTAFGWSLYALFWGRAGQPGLRDHFAVAISRVDGGGQIYLEVAAGVTTFILAGRYLEQRAKREAGSALRALLDLAGSEAAVLRPGPRGQLVERRLPVAELVLGDRFVVRPGERIATDGTIEQGNSAVDTSMLTGESAPGEVGPGSPVVGGSVNAGGRLVVRATRLGGDTFLARITAMVEQAQAGKASVARLADRVAAVFVPTVIAAALLTALGWLVSGHGLAVATQAGVAVLVIACPCALGLATPTALLAGTGRGAQLGILISGPEVLESARRVDTVVWDKTGTLTTGQLRVERVLAAPGVDSRFVLRLAAAVEDGSLHPAARAILRKARAEQAAVPGATHHVETPGLGIRARVDGHTVVVGRPAFLSDHGLRLPHPLAELMRDRAGGASVVAVGWDGWIRGAVLLVDTVEATARQAIQDLQRLGLSSLLLTGDSAAAAERVAREIGVETVIAGVLPEEKLAVVRALQAEGRVVAMIGDGVNDAAALATADLGLAMGTGTDAAMQAADLTLVNGDPRTAGHAIELARATLSVIRANLFWAFAYNVLALPLAALGLLDPMLAGAAMACSSLFVVGNSLRLRRFRPGQDEGTRGAVASALTTADPSARPRAHRPPR